MSARREIERRIEKKRERAARLKEQIREEEIYISALEDTLKLLPREGVNDGNAETVLRPNSVVAKARKVLLSHGEPMHIQRILAAMGKKDGRDSRSALAGSLGAYVRRGEIFYRSAPNTFGLLELANEPHSAAQPKATGDNESNKPPPHFGQEADEERIEFTDADVPF